MMRIAIIICAGMLLVTILGLVPGCGMAVADGHYRDPQPPPPNAMNVIADTLILRPVGLIMIPVTGLIYVIGYPFSWAAGNQEETYQSLLGDTIDFTFRRPMGRGEPFD